MNVIDQAESLCKNRVPDELTAGECECCNILPDLVAECKRLQEDNHNMETLNAALLENGNDLRERAQKAEAEAARWQGLRPEVQIFAEAMERKLRQNDHKGGWENMPLGWLRGRLGEETKELDVSITAYIDEIECCGDLSKPRQAILLECADVANFAMMIAANCKGLEAAAALGKPRAWAMTDERIKALDEAANLLAWAISEATLVEKREARSARAMLRDMLAEAKQ